MIDNVSTERRQLERAGRFHWVHWVVVMLSLALTFLAWHSSKSQIDEKIERQFDREVKQVVWLVQEQMQKYEDALWSGVALHHTQNGDVDYDEWAAFSQSIRIEQKYPGINGIGVIHALESDEVPAYLARERARRPDYKIHPPHDQNLFYPITYIEPVESNSKAVGLDMAHETNRFTAAKKARDTGDAQITGPIVLVQDDDRTPGFLFYAPFYDGSIHPSPEDRARTFRGMVYAPFVVKRLMEGVLDKENRHVGIRVVDEEETLYDELVPDEADFDPDPQFKITKTIPMYGRNWTFDIASSRSFRIAQASSQPLIILCSGIMIDIMLIGLFMFLAKANRSALRLADLTTKELRHSNAELDDFAYIASHDLKEPLRGLNNYASFLIEDYEELLDDDGKDKLHTLQRLSIRMETLIDSLLEISRVGRVDMAIGPTDMQVILDDVIDSLKPRFETENVEVIVSRPMPTIRCDRIRVAEVFRNLLTNAMKYNDKAAKQIEVGFIGPGDPEAIVGDDYIFFVRDNGIGVPAHHLDKLFKLFKRLHGRNEYGGGTGAGLTIVKKIVERHQGVVWAESKVGDGTTFKFTLKTAA